LLNTTDYTRVIWNRDSYGTPPGTNLYGDHPVYFDHRGASGTHAVFLLNSNGKNIKIDDSTLEYDLLGGVLDLYFLAGPTPVEAAQQYSEVVGKSAMMPYWGMGYHQCRYGMRDVYEVAEVVANYSAAGIPLETMWTDIDYMYLRRVFTLDPVRFPLSLMRELVSTIHSRGQHYVVMVDPAVAYQDYPAFNEGRDQDVFYKRADGSIFEGVVWPGVTAFPDWFHPNTQSYWTDEFRAFFDPATGVDIDALWIDMNEAANFCNWPCTNATLQAKLMGNPPRPPAVRLGPDSAIAGFPASFQPQCKAQISFNVNATTRYGENILVLGSVGTLGGGDISNAAPLGADRYPIWGAIIDVPADTTITYQYVRIETDGSYVYENTNRTVTSTGCNSQPQNVEDQITTSTPPQMQQRRHGAPQIETFHTTLSSRQATGDMLGLPGRDLINPTYQIGNAAGSLSNKTLDTDLVDYGGTVQYDTHNLYGAQMSEASRIAMLNRRPTVRPMIITRSTFAGSGHQVGKWLGDNFADWAHYLQSIKQVLEFAALYQVPTVGADVCGFGGNTNERLCARWATLGAFSPFYRNHGELGATPHEFYRWPLVAKAARNAIAIRYKLLDYIYTSLYLQSTTGTPLVQPMFFHYPSDPNVNALGYQYFYGPGILVAPVTEENSTTATFYLPNDTFYDYYTHDVVQGTGSAVTRENVDFTTIPLFYKAGNIIVQRTNSANTTTELRKQPFTLIVAADAQGKADGTLYLDDGESIEQPAYSLIQFSYDNRRLVTSGHFGYDPDVGIVEIVVLGSGVATGGGENTAPASYGRSAKPEGGMPLTKAWSASV
jgi:alpha-glucosidase